MSKIEPVITEEPRPQGPPEFQQPPPGHYQLPAPPQAVMQPAQPVQPVMQPAQPVQPVMQPAQPVQPVMQPAQPVQPVMQQPQMMQGAQPMMPAVQMMQPQPMMAPAHPMMQQAHPMMQQAQPMIPMHQQTSTNVVVINQQPAARPAPREWSSGLCDCCDDCGICFYGFCCAGFMLRDIARRLKESTCCCCPLPLLALRVKFRIEQNIQGSLWDDYVDVTCCGMLALCQLARELDYVERTQGV